MEHKKSEILLLLTILVMFCASVGMLHGRKKTGATQEIKSNTLDIKEGDLTVNEVLSYIQPLLHAHSTHIAAELVQKLMGQQQWEVVQKVLYDKESSLNNREKVLFAIATVYLRLASKKQSSDIFSLLKEFYQTADTDPLLFIIAQSDYSNVIKELVEFIKQEKLSDNWIDQAMEKAVSENSVHVLETLYAQGIRISSQRASRLLWDAVRGGNDPMFVRFLVRQGGADSNYVYQGRTVLIKSVEENSINMVRALLEQGANPSLITDPAVGTAKQIAFDKGYAQIERLLDEYEGMEK